MAKKKLTIDDLLGALKNPDGISEDMKREQYLDLAIFTLSGVFILFLLDIVLYFGKSLNKK